MVLAQQGKPPLENVRNLEGVCVCACTHVHVHISVLRLRGFTINVIEARDLRNAQTALTVTLPQRFLSGTVTDRN